jgi:hypothetical protein
MTPDQILAWFVADGRVAVPLSEFPPDDEESILAVADLSTRELLVAWEDDTGPVWSLTSLAVSIHKLTLDTDGVRWLKPGHEPSDPIKEVMRIGRGRVYFERDMNGHAGNSGGRLDGLTGDDDDLDERIDAREREEQERLEREAEAFAAEIQGLGRRHRCSLPPIRHEVPEPVLLLLGCRPWPVPSDGHDGSCGVCHGADMPPEVLCLHCLRSGIDERLAMLDRPAMSRSRPATGEPKGSR